MYHATLTLFICLITSGCAYNYAGQEGKNRQKRPDPKNVEVVSVEEDEEAKRDTETDESVPTDPVEPEASPCGVEKFDVHQYAADGLMKKTIECRSGDTVDVERVPLSDNAYQRMKDDGYPPGKWYIVVEPRSVADGVLNNDHLLQMSREFEIDYFGRIDGGDQLVYLFLSPVQ